ncbi:MAG TPA: nuclear transport factor 2 family protein [Mycobacterium sp.]|jgi:limonene-1,2-epoxide hydrolase
MRGDVVERYLAAMAAHDWDALAATITDDGIVREGPFCDVVEGKQPYVAFLRGILTALQNYSVDIRRIWQASERVWFVELTETFDVGGNPASYPECILFETGDDGLICYVSVFIKQPGADAPVSGGRA